MSNWVNKFTLGKLFLRPLGYTPQEMQVDIASETGLKWAGGIPKVFPMHIEPSTGSFDYENVAWMEGDTLKYKEVNYYTSTTLKSGSNNLKYSRYRVTSYPLEYMRGYACMSLTSVLNNRDSFLGTGSFTLYSHDHPTNGYGSVLASVSYSSDKNGNISFRGDSKVESFGFVSIDFHNVRRIHARVTIKFEVTRPMPSGAWLSASVQGGSGVNGWEDDWANLTQLYFSNLSTSSYRNGLVGFFIEKI
ncbi:MAG: hypothetical protein ACRCZ0_08290 [Cetobacterium sp.]